MNSPKAAVEQQQKDQNNADQTANTIFGFVRNIFGDVQKINGTTDHQQDVRDSSHSQSSSGMLDSKKVNSSNPNSNYSPTATQTSGIN